MTDSTSCPHPFSFLNPKIQPTGILTLKSRIPFRIVHENGSAVPVSIHQPNLTAVKFNPELPLQSILLQFPLIVQNLTLAIQLSTQMLCKDVPYGKIIQSPFSTQTFKMLPGLENQRFHNCCSCIRLFSVTILRIEYHRIDPPYLPAFLSKCHF